MEKFQVEFAKPAQHDLAKIREYIETVSSDEFTAAQFCSRLLDTALSLELAPERGALLRKRPGRRFIVFKPYLIIYRIIDEKNIVLVLRFWHGAQDPKKLQL